MSGTTVRAAAVGEQAPPLELPDLAGSVTRLSDLRGQPVLLSFLRHGG